MNTSKIILLGILTILTSCNGQTITESKIATDPFELLNTDGWIKYIGNRNIHSEADAAAYIQKMNENPDTTYWSVTLKEPKIPIGLITLIKQDDLDFNDIGFAFLPTFSQKGYAYEAAKAVLLNLAENNIVENILAITLPENKSSIRLIEKLGFLKK